MDGENKKFVKFSEFCPKCESEAVKETLEPCNSCLEVAARDVTVVPEKFVERKSKKSEDENGENN